MGENIGAVARAMGNFGLSNLRIVKPRDDWPNPAAASVAAHALPIVERAQIFDTLAEAIADCHHVWATAAFLRDMSQPVWFPREILWPVEGKTAIIFGRENNGLSNEEIAQAQALITIPVHPDCPSLNIAQAVAVVAYEWFQHQPEQFLQSSDAIKIRPAPQELVEGFFGQLESALDTSFFWKEANKKKKMWQNLRSIFLRSALSEQEVQTLRGMLRSLTDHHR